MKKQQEEFLYLQYFRDSAKWNLLEKIDRAEATAGQEKGCLHCGGRLDVSNIDRLPRGGPGWELRFSFCCAVDGCRKRFTPQSVRFLDRKVYAGFVVVLMTVMHQGATPARVRALAEHFAIDRRTLEHWRKWWKNTFVRSRCWQAMRGMFAGMPPAPEDMPWSLLAALERQAGTPDPLLTLLRLLAPMTVAGPARKRAF